MDRDKESIEEIRKLCEENQVGFEETVSTITPSTLKKDKRFDFIKEMKKQGKDYFFIEYARSLNQIKALIKNYFEKKHIHSDYLAKLRQIVLANKNKVYFIIEKVSDSELLFGDLISEIFPNIDDRIKLCINVTKAVIDIRAKLFEKVKDQKSVTLYGISTEKFNFRKEYKKIEFVNIGIDEFTVTENDQNDKRFWPPEKFTCLFRNVDKYKLDIYSLGCVLFELIAAHPPLEENTAAAYDLVKEKKSKLISEFCENRILEELEYFGKKNELLDLIKRMTELEESQRTITFEEVEKILCSFLPSDYHKVKCSCCLEKAEVFIKDSFEKYCEICRSFYASKNESKFYKDNTIPIKEMYEETIPDLLRKEKNSLEYLELNNKFNQHIESIKENENILSINSEEINGINKKFDNLIEFLQERKKSLNNHFSEIHKSNKLFFGKTLSIFSNVQSLVQTTINQKNTEREQISSHQQSYNNDYELVVTDVKVLDKSIKRTSDLEKVCEIFSYSFDNKMNNLLQKQNKQFEQYFEIGGKQLSYIEEVSSELDKIVDENKLIKIKSLVEVGTKIEEILGKSNVDERVCLEIAENPEFNRIIKKNESLSIDEEGDSVYVKQN